MSRVFVVRVSFDDASDGLRLPDDISAVRAAVERERAALLIIDPIVATFSGAVDSHNDASVRRALGPLSHLAHETRCAVLAVSHTNKSPATSIHQRTGGSIGFTGAARNVFLIAADPRDPAEGRVLLHGKSNTGGLAPALTYRMEEVTYQASVAGPPIKTVRVQWGAEAPGLSVEDALAAPEDAETRAASDEARDFLETALATGCRLARELTMEAEQAGIADRTLRRVRPRVCGSKRVGFGAGAKTWWWLRSRPDDAP
jgi:putative DNA primase/helicase